VDLTYQAARHREGSLQLHFNMHVRNTTNMVVIIGTILQNFGIPKEGGIWRNLELGCEST
jgi:hypothetical protein